MNLSEADFRMHVFRRLDEQDDKLDTLIVQNEKLDELLGILKASKVGANIIKWCAGLVATVLGALELVRRIK